MAKLTSVSVTVTPPGGAPFALNMTDPDLVRSGGVSVVGAMTAAWGVEYPGQHQAAGGFALSVYSFETNPIPLGSRVVVTAQVDGGTAGTVAVGWALTPKWKPYDVIDGQTRWLVKVACEGIVARLSGLKLPAADWPAEDLDARLARILAGAGVSTFYAIGSFSVPARRSPGTESAWDALTTLLADPIGEYCLLETADGIRHGQIAPTIDFNTALDGPGIVVLGMIADILDLPAAAIGQVWRGQNRSASPSQVSVSWTDALGESQTTVYDSPTDTPIQSGELSFTTQRSSLPADWPARVEDRLNDLAISPPVVPMESLPVKLDQLTTAQLEALLFMVDPVGLGDAITASRAGRIIRITDSAYSDMDALQTITGAALTIWPDLSANITLDMLTPRAGGIRPLRFSDLPDGTDGIWAPVGFSDLRVGVGTMISARDTLAVVSPGYIHF